MQWNQKLCLSADAWNDLTDRLSHTGQTCRQKVDAFLEEMNVQVTSSQGKIFAESNHLDESAILALLRPKADPRNTAPFAGLSQSYSIHIQLFVDADSFPFLGDQPASERSYLAYADPRDQFYSMDAGCNLMSA